MTNKTDWKFDVTKTGEIKELCFGKEKVLFRNDAFSGPALFTENNSQEIKLLMENKTDLKSSGSNNNGLNYSIEYKTDDCFHIVVTVNNDSNATIRNERMFLRLGIDNYMQSYPQWDDILFPTLLRCERDFFWGYMMSPANKILAIGCNSPLKSWKLNYNKLDANQGGHRIYTVDLDLFNSLPQPERHPDGFTELAVGETSKWDIKLKFCEDIKNVVQVCSELAEAPILQAECYTLQNNQKAKIMAYSNNDLKIKVQAPSGKITEFNHKNCGYENSIEFSILQEVGEHKLYINDGNKTSQASIYLRKNWSWYLDKARDAALEKPQKATTHLEPWYGFFSIFLGMKHLPNSQKDAKGVEHFDKVLSKMYDMETALPLTDPGRICNTAVAISMLVDAFEATQDVKYIDFASKLGDFLIYYQHKDGSYRAYMHDKKYNQDGTEAINNGVHYTSVIYVLKSMLELTIVEKRLANTSDKYKHAYNMHYASATRAADNLLFLLDDVDTEGELTFEDGMISCSALQLGMFAYLQENKEAAEKYLNAAKLLIEKHRCLQQMLIPDCKTHGGTLRFWEAQYDILLDSNMINSPHGWTSWKTYATYYLYLLTGNIDYLQQTMDTLGACMQMVDCNSGDLRWAFICDPCITTGVWVQDQAPNYGKRINKVIGEQYMDMISGWWKTLDDEPVGAYLTMPLRTSEGLKKCDNIGGCCDNDVHEHFKCLEEVALTKGYIAKDKEGKIICFNCSYQYLEQKLHIYPQEEIVTHIHINLDGVNTVVVHFKNYLLEEIIDKMKWVDVYNSRTLEFLV